MIDREKVIFDIGRCICHVQDACRDCSHYGHSEEIGCMEELLADALELIKSSRLIHTEHALYTVYEKNGNGKRRK